MFPIRCLTCNKPVTHTIDFIEYKKKNNVKSFLDKYNIKRYCCRRMYITYVEIKPLPIMNSILKL